MSSLALATRNRKEAMRNPMSLALNLLLPAGLLLVLASIGGEDSDTLNATFLTPGVALFGFVMVMFTSSMLLARDRETALFDRLRSAPLRASDFGLAYALPALLVAVLQAAIVFTLGGVLGMEIAGSALLVVTVLVLMAVFYVALGIAAGALLTLAATTGAYTAVLLLTVFGGTWFRLDDIGGPVKTIAGFLPFSHAIDAMRAVMEDGAGLADIAGDLAWVAVFAVGAAALAVGSVRKRMLE
ncbi:MAG: ABC transporter permease [Ilumatobacteraceae bacterium]